MSTPADFPAAALIGPASAPVAQWLELVRVADTDSLHMVCQAFGRGQTRRSSNRTVKRLEEAGLAVRSRRAHTSDILATASARGYTPRSLSHDLIVSRVSAIALGGGWSWDRDVAAQNEHTADGILYDGAGRRIAVEVEMTRKSISRTRQILLRHSRVPDRYTRVLYVGPRDIMTYIERIAGETGTAAVLCGAVPAVEHWTHEVDRDQLARAFGRLIDTVAAPGHQPTLPYPGPVPPPAPAAATHSQERTITDEQILNFRVPLPAPHLLTSADRIAAQRLLAQRLTRAEVAGDERTVQATRQRQEEIANA
ncbi:hypothetical protein AAFP30_27895 [Gordonia sp. CPCC 205515]|uniref:hypothetical protein n=1 Tax=Gordonia sp. CPCC 205515 TaxID=3140791 RepID=UPI003AF38935